MHLNIVFTMNNYIEEFLKEWPLDRILTMSIDDYVIGKGAKVILFAIVLRGVNTNLYF